MNKIFRKCAATVLSVVFLSAVMPLKMPDVSATSGIGVKYRSAEEIAKYISAHPFNYDDATFSVKPNYTKAPYSAGKLSDKSQKNTLNALNNVRFIAGLNEVQLLDDYSELAQAAALVNAVNDDLSHYPPKPAGMSDALYNKGASGASSSNLAWNYGSLADSVISAWMSDADDYNIDRIGHRRWCINPSMGKTGFGNVGTYYAMYAFDHSGSSSNVSGVCWPAQNTPVGYFANNDPWSISMGYEVNASNVKVSLVRKNDGKTWKFSKSSADGYFNVDNDGYGQIGCIIFRPDNISYKVGDSFDVSVTGLDRSVNYTVSFFDPASYQTVSPSKYYTGDVNLNDKIDFLDLVDVARHLAGSGKMSADLVKVGDVNKSGDIDFMDLVIISRKLIAKA